MLGTTEIYLIIINTIGFIFNSLNIFLNKRQSYKINILLSVLSLLGATLGIIISILLFDKKSTKDNMMFRVFATCLFIIQITIFIMLNYNDKSITLPFNIKNNILLYYLVIINILTFIIFGLDKRNACKSRRRYKIVTLLGLCFIGGSLGGLLAMHIFHHKTTINYFTWGIPMIILMHIVVMFFLVNIVAIL